MSALGELKNKKEKTDLDAAVLSSGYYEAQATQFSGKAKTTYTEKAASELATLRDDKLKLEIAARDFLRATDMHGEITQEEFFAARDTLAAMVNKGDE